MCEVLEENYTVKENNIILKISKSVIRRKSNAGVLD